MRTSEDVFNRLRWDAAWGEGEEIFIGFEDRIIGPLEVIVVAFNVPKII